jgi:hypothetical protein
MHDFDANEDLARLRAAGQEEAAEPADGPQADRPVPGARRLHGPRSRPEPRRDVRTPAHARSALTRARRTSRSACPRVVGVPFARARSRVSWRRWATCHGRPPGSRR